MSDAQHDEHEPLIKTPKQLIITVIAAFAVPILVIILLANYVGLGVKEGAGSSGMSEEAVNDRIKPVAHLELKDPNAPRVYKTGEQLYKEVCATCHAAGVAGAPKFGDAASWGPRLSQGLEGLTKVALAGKGGMPARGGTSPDDVSDYEIERAIVYMANSAGGKLQEPPAPAGAAAAPAGASAPQASASASAPAAAPAAAAAAAPAAPA
ncbi:c-type cytochrome, partial [Ralstonia mannitolilytica]